MAFHHHLASSKHAVIHETHEDMSPSEHGVFSCKTLSETPQEHSDALAKCANHMRGLPIKSQRATSVFSNGPGLGSRQATLPGGAASNSLVCRGLDWVLQYPRNGTSISCQGRFQQSTTDLGRFPLASMVRM